MFALAGAGADGGGEMKSDNHCRAARRRPWCGIWHHTTQVSPCFALTQVSAWFALGPRTYFGGLCCTPQMMSASTVLLANIPKLRIHLNDANGSSTKTCGRGIYSKAPDPGFNDNHTSAHCHQTASSATRHQSWVASGLSSRQCVMAHGGRRYGGLWATGRLLPHALKAARVRWIRR